MTPPARSLPPPGPLPRGGRPALQYRAGFTLVELLMGIAVAMAFAIALYSFFFSGLDAANTHQSQTRAQNGLRTAVELLSRDLRQAVSPDGGINGGIMSLNATSLVVHVDPNRDPAATVPKPLRVRYRLLGEQLVREVARPIGAAPPYSYTAYSPPVVLVEPLRNGATPLFQAFTRQGAPLASPVAQTRDITTVRIRLIAGQKTGLQATTTELSTDVTLRNTARY